MLIIFWALDKRPPIAEEKSFSTSPGVGRLLFRIIEKVDGCYSIIIVVIDREADLDIIEQSGFIDIQLFYDLLPSQ